MYARTTFVLTILPLAAVAQDATHSFEHGYYLEHARRDFAAAAESYRAAIAAAGDDAELASRAKTRLAACLVELGRRDEARALFAEAGVDEVPAVPATALWRAPLASPIDGAIVAGGKYLAFRDSNGALHLGSRSGVAVHESRPGSSSSRGLQPLVWSGGNLLLASRHGMAVLDMWHGQIELSWELLGSDGPAGGWPGGPEEEWEWIVVGRDGCVWRGDRESATRGALAHRFPGPVDWAARMPDGRVVTLRRREDRADLSVWNVRGADAPSQVVSWTSPPGERLEKILLAGDRVVTVLSARGVIGLSLAGTQVTERAIGPDDVAALAASRDGRMLATIDGAGRVTIRLAEGPELGSVDLGLAGIEQAAWMDEQLVVATRSEIVAFLAPRPWRVHRVAAGESLYELARRYYGHGSEWRRIADANPVAEEGLKQGDELVIPNRTSDPEPNPELSSLLAVREQVARRAEEGLATVMELELMDLEIARVRRRSGELDEAAYRRLVEPLIESQLARLDALLENRMITAQDFLERRRWVEAFRKP